MGRQGVMTPSGRKGLDDLGQGAMLPEMLDPRRKGYDAAGTAWDVAEDRSTGQLPERPARYANEMSATTPRQRGLVQNCVRLMPKTSCRNCKTRLISDGRFAEARAASQNRYPAPGTRGDAPPTTAQTGRFGPKMPMEMFTGRLMSYMLP